MCFAGWSDGSYTHGYFEWIWEYLCWMGNILDPKQVLSRLVNRRLVTEADVVRAKTSVEMTQDLINEKHRKIEQIENRIREKVAP
jgi:hypothetical protein